MADELTAWKSPETGKQTAGAFHRHCFICTLHAAHGAAANAVEKVDGRGAVEERMGGVRGGLHWRCWIERSSAEAVAASTGGSGNLVGVLGPSGRLTPADRRTRLISQ